MGLFCAITTVFSYIEENKEKYIDNLREVVNIPSVSALPERRDDIKKVVLLVSEKLQNLGVKVKLHDVGEQVIIELVMSVTYKFRIVKIKILKCKNDRFGGIGGYLLFQKKN